MKARLAVVSLVLLWVLVAFVASQPRRVYAGAEFLTLGYGNTTALGGSDIHATQGYMNASPIGTPATSVSMNGFGNSYPSMNTMLVVTLESATECSNVFLTNCSTATLTATVVATPSTTGVCQKIYMRTTATSGDTCYQANWTNNNVTGEMWEALIPNSLASQSVIDGAVAIASSTATAGFVGAAYTTTSPDTLVVTVSGTDTSESSYTTSGDSLFAVQQKLKFAAVGNVGQYTSWSARNVAAAGFAIPTHAIVGSTPAAHVITTTFGIKPLYPPPFIAPSATFADSTHCGTSSGGAGSIVQTGTNGVFTITVGHNGGAAVTSCPVAYNLTFTTGSSCSISSPSSSTIPTQTFTTTGVTLAATDMKDNVFRLDCSGY